MVIFDAHVLNLNLSNTATVHDLHGGVVGGLVVGGCVVGAFGSAEAGRMEQLPLLNLKSSTAMSPV